MSQRSEERKKGERGKEGGMGWRDSVCQKSQALDSRNLNFTFIIITQLRLLSSLRSQMKFADHMKVEKKREKGKGGKDPLIPSSPSLTRILFPTFGEEKGMCPHMLWFDIPASTEL